MPKRKDALPKKQRIIAIIKALEEGGGIDEACIACDVSPSTFWRWRKADPKLEAKARNIYQSKTQGVEQSLMKRAMGFTFEEVRSRAVQAQGGRPAMMEITKTLKYYPPDVGACAFILKNRLPDLWQDNRENLAGNSPIENADAVRELLSDLYRATEVPPPLPLPTEKILVARGVTA